MTSVQVHLALTHVPVILSFVGLGMLIVALINSKNTTLTQTAYVVLVVAGLAAIPVFLTGEGAEEAIENLPGVSEAIIESHEEIADFSFIAILVAGAVAMLGLFAGRWPQVNRPIKIVLLLISLAAAGLMLQTAHLGGQIRHTEVRTGAAVVQGESGEED